MTYLAQAHEHIAEARDLIDGGHPSTHDLDTAYDAATDATSRAQTILMEVYRTEQRTEALTELSDFYARAIPQVDAMQPRVPAASLPAWQRLRDLLGAGDVATLRELAACGACGKRATAARRALTGLTGTSRPGSAGNSNVRPGRPAVAARRRQPLAPPAVDTTPARASVPPVTGLNAARRDRQPAGRRRGQLVGGCRWRRGHRARATVSLPHVGVTSSTIGIGGGGATPPGATIPLPSVTLGVPLLPTKVLPTTILPTPGLP